jgi:hypothetical protein
MKDEIKLTNIFKAFIQTVAGCEQEFCEQDTIIKYCTRDTVYFRILTSRQRPVSDPKYLDPILVDRQQRQSTKWHSVDRST